jgi:hypothetical protein
MLITVKDSIPGIVVIRIDPLVFGDVVPDRYFNLEILSRVEGGPERAAAIVESRWCAFCSTQRMEEAYHRAGQSAPIPGATVLGIR